VTGLCLATHSIEKCRWLEELTSYLNARPPESRKNLYILVITLFIIAVVISVIILFGKHHSISIFKITD